MNQLRVNIPFWYKPFVRFMPKFWEDMPEEKHGNWGTRVDVVTSSFVNPRHHGKRRGKYQSLQRAYLRARWRALWKDIRTAGSYTGVEWVIVDNNKRVVKSYGRLPKVEDVMDKEDIWGAESYYSIHKNKIDKMMDSTDYGYDVEKEDMHSPELWKEGHWLWFMNVRKKA